MFEFVVALVSWIWDGIQVVADYAVVALTWAYQALKAFGGAVWDAAKFTYTDIIKPIGAFLKDAYDRLKAIYDKVLAPVVAWAKRITDVVRKVYTTYIQPVLSTIDALRSVLELLALLHIEWAAQLDAALAALERKITGPLQLVISVINGLVNRIESYVLTVDNLFTKATHLATVARDLNRVTNMSLSRMMGSLTQEQRDGPTGSDALASTADHVQTLDNVIAGNFEAVNIDGDGIMQALRDSLAA